MEQCCGLKGLFIKETEGRLGTSMKPWYILKAASLIWVQNIRMEGNIWIVPMLLVKPVPFDFSYEVTLITKL